MRKRQQENRPQDIDSERFVRGTWFWIASLNYRHAGLCVAAFDQTGRGGCTGSTVARLRIRGPSHEFAPRKTMYSNLCGACSHLHLHADAGEIGPGGLAAIGKTGGRGIRLSGVRRTGNGAAGKPDGLSAPGDRQDGRTARPADHSTHGAVARPSVRRPGRRFRPNRCRRPAGIRKNRFHSMG